MRFLVSKDCVAERVSNQFLGKSKKEQHLVFFLRHDLAQSFCHRYTVTTLLLH